MGFDVKAFFTSQITLGVTRFENDLRAIPVEARGKSPGGIARSPNDLAFELATGNREFARRMRGEEAIPMGHDEMPRATTEFGDVDHAVAELKAATEEFLKAWSAVPEGGLEKTLADGKLTPLGLATIVNRHIHYHDAQLNYVQTLLGDSEIHW